MGTTIRARFSKGVFQPLERLDLSEGEVLMLTIITSKSPSIRRRVRSSWSGANGLAGRTCGLLKLPSTSSQLVNSHLPWQVTITRARLLDAEDPSDPYRSMSGQKLHAPERKNLAHPP
jgi:predicted DNA-binding antitoxin AbrB/MazE fold protein